MPIGTWQGLRLVRDVDVMKERVQRLDAGNAQAGVPREPERDAQVGFDLHGSSRNEVLIHDAVVLGRPRHGPYDLGLEIFGEAAFLTRGDLHELFDGIRDQRSYADFLDQFRVRRRLEDDAGGVEGDGSNTRQSLSSARTGPSASSSTCQVGGRGEGGNHRRRRSSSPDHALVLLLPDVLRHLAIHLAGAQGHGQGLGHVGLHGGGDVRVPVGRSDPHLARAMVLKLARAQLRDLGLGHEREHDVGVVALLELGLDTEGVCGVEQDAGVMGRHDRLDDGGQVVHVRQGLDAEQDVVEGAGQAAGLFGRPDDWRRSVVSVLRAAVAMR